MGIIFNGRQFADKELLILKNKVEGLINRDIHISFTSILVGDDPASLLYTKLKEKAASQIGIDMKVERFGENASVEEIKSLIENLNNNKNCRGILIQLPLPLNFSDEDKNELIDTISSSKDVDGMKEKSSFKAATVGAIIKILNYSINLTHKDINKILVVGSKGEVGRRLLPVLREYLPQVDIVEIDIQNTDELSKANTTDVIISATGQEKILKNEHIGKGAIVIDVGAPKGDIDFESVKEKCAFITPVPKGVGPVTISSLLENVVVAASK